MNKVDNAGHVTITIIIGATPYIQLYSHVLTVYYPMY